MATYQPVTKTTLGLNNVTNDAQLKAASNLSDLNNAATARGSLGLGTAATVADSTLVHMTGNETVGGTKTFSSDVLVPDEAYHATNWDGSLEVPTKNAVRDKIESLALGATTLNGLTDVATGTLADYDVLFYNISAGEWNNQPIEANLVSFSPSGTLTSTDVQSAIEELAGDAIARTVTTADTATLTVNSSANDRATVTALAQALTIAAPTGTPVDGQRLILRLKDNGTARALTWNAIFRAIGVTLPTTTTISKTLYIACVYNSADTKWDVLSVAQEG